MKNKKILIVEDDLNILEGIKDNLEAEDLIVQCVNDGAEGLDVALEGSFDLILLDVMLPSLNGFEVCKKLRKEKISTPIIILTARGEEVDKVVGLEIGADDYVTKPFSIRELIARIHAHLRRQENLLQPKEIFEINDAKIDFTKFETTKNGKNIDLTPLEYKVLQYFIQKPDQVISRDELIENVWKYEAQITTRTIDNHILKLRKLVETDPRKPKHFITVHGVGYKFIY